MPSPAPVCPEPAAPTERSLRLHGSRGKADRGRAEGHRATKAQEAGEIGEIEDKGVERARRGAAGAAGTRLSAISRP